jgi:hypothetical protein
VTDHGASHAGWVAAASREAPTELAARVTQVLAMHPEWDALPVSEALTRAGESLLHGVLARSGTHAQARDRANALDLLAADACVTWALEAAAASDTDGVPAFAQGVMTRILSSTGPAEQA